MFQKNMRIAYLLDFYQDVLDGHTAAVMRAYYNDDLSLAEIANDEGISRQGIRHLIKKGEESLEFFEEKLGLVRRHEELAAVCDGLSALSAKLPDEISRASLDNAIQIIMKGNQDVRESY